MLTKSDFKITNFYQMLNLSFKLLFTMESATAAGSSQSNISRIIFEKTNKANRNYSLKDIVSTDDDKNNRF